MRSRGDARDRSRRAAERRGGGSPAERCIDRAGRVGVAVVVDLVRAVVHLLHGHDERSGGQRRGETVLQVGRRVGQRVARGRRSGSCWTWSSDRSGRRAAPRPRSDRTERVHARTARRRRAVRALPPPCPPPPMRSPRVDRRPGRRRPGPPPPLHAAERRVQPASDQRDQRRTRVRWMRRWVMRIASYGRRSRA